MRGHVRKRGSKWEAIVDLGRQPVQVCDACNLWTWLDDGRQPACAKCGGILSDSTRRRQKSRLGFPTKREAEAWIANRLALIQRGEDPFPERITLSAYCARWLEHQATRVRPRTAERYAQLLNNHALPLLGNLLLDRIRPAHVQAVLDQMSSAGLAPRTRIQARAVLSSLLRQAVAWGLITTNPATAVRPPKPERPNLAVPSPEKLSALIEAARNEGCWEIPVLLAVTTGARRSEVLALGWSGVDLKAGRIAITRTLQKGEHGRGAVFADPKTDRARRTLALLPAVVERLRQHRKDQLERRLLLAKEWNELDLVCERGDGLYLTPDAFTDAFKRIAIKASLDPRTRLHDVRHGVATAMLAQGVHPAIASAVLGHSSPAFTMTVYQHVLDGMTDQAANALSDVLGL